MRVGAEIDHEGLRAAIGEGMDFIDERAFMGGLEEGNCETDLLGLGADHFLEVFERSRAINGRLAAAEAVKIGAVEDGNFFHR